MLDRKKVNPALGEEVHKYLLEKGVETPMIEKLYIDKVGVVTKQKLVIADAFRTIMEALSLDLTDDSLMETPRRMAKMYVDELYAGLDYNNFPKITAVENKMNYNTMLLERHIAVKSTCEHHFVAFMGEAAIAYIPKDKVIGLSKLNRIVEFFSRRPQIQERLTEQIFHTLCYILGTDNVAVVIKAQHFCVKLRGVEDVNSDTVTSRLGGVFAENEKTRAELYQLIQC